MYTSGYYQVNQRALRFGEVARFRGRGRIDACFAYVTSRFRHPQNAVWMPYLWADGACEKSQLSEEFWRATASKREALEKLGFTPCQFKKLTRHLNPKYLDNGSVKYLDRNRCHYAQLTFFQIRSGASVNQVRVVISISFSAALKEGSVTYTNQLQSFDTAPNHTVIRVASIEVEFIYQQFLEKLKGLHEFPRQFSDLESLQKWVDAQNLADFEDRVRRGLYVRMTDAQVKAAEERLVQPKVFPPPPKGVFSMHRGAWTVVAFVASILLWPHFSPFKSKDTTIEYQGEHFKMSRAYETYEDYKDDPNNLDTNELGRIEQTMERAKMPGSFDSRKAFFDALFDLRFPGYGVGAVGAKTHTDDASTLMVESVEIPQRAKERIFVVRDFHGQFDLLDDFVFGEATNEIQFVNLRSNKLEYYDGQRNLIRVKQP